MNTKPSNKKNFKRPANMIGAGLVIGAGVGVALDNIAVGIVVGIAIGAALTKKQKQKLRKRSFLEIKIPL